MGIYYYSREGGRCRFVCTVKWGTMRLCSVGCVTYGWPGDRGWRTAVELLRIYTCLVHLSPLVSNLPHLSPSNHLSSLMSPLLSYPLFHCPLFKKKNPTPVLRFFPSNLSLRSFPSALSSPAVDRQTDSRMNLKQSISWFIIGHPDCHSLSF